MVVTEILLNERPFFFRDGTSDSLILSKNLLCKPEEREYQFMPGQPDVILDIGANIGCISILMSALYPDAKIYSFEPVKDNYDLLIKNIEHYKNIIPFNFAIGSKNESREILSSSDDTNFGGHSFNEQGCDSEKKKELVEVRDINEIINELSIETINLIKIDCEGSEHEILTGMSQENIAKVQLIIGELHSYKDYDLLSYLSTMFHIELNKKFEDVNYQFRALVK